MRSISPETESAPSLTGEKPGSELRVLSVITRFGTGGSPVSVVNGARGMKQYGYQTVIATGTCAPGEGDMSYLLEPEDHVEWVPEMSRSVSFGSDLLALAKMVRLARQVKPDIVHTHTAKAGALGRVAGWLAGAPVIIHTYHGTVFRGYFSPLGSWCVRMTEKLLSNLTTAICVLSPQQQREVVDDFHVVDGRKVHILPLGFDLSAFEALPPPPVAWQPLTVGWFGRLAPIKNVPLLASVIEESIQTIPGVRFLIAGDGPERDTACALMSRFGRERVDYLGWRRDVAPIMRECDVLIQTSQNEGTPGALIQGMAAGRPFVSTPVGGVPDMTFGEKRQRGESLWSENAVLVPPDGAAFSRVLAELSGDRQLLVNMGTAARQHALRAYSLSQAFKATDQLYRQLLSRARKKKAKAAVSESMHSAAEEAV